MNAAFAHRVTESIVGPGRTRIILATTSSPLRRRVTSVCSVQDIAIDVTCAETLEDTIEAATEYGVALIFLGDTLEGGTLLDALAGLKGVDVPKVALVPDPDIWTRTSLLRAGSWSVVDTAQLPSRKLCGERLCPIEGMLRHFLNPQAPQRKMKRHAGGYERRWSDFGPSIAPVETAPKLSRSEVRIH